MRNLSTLCLFLGVSLFGCALDTEDAAPAPVKSAVATLGLSDAHTFDVKPTIVDANGAQHVRIAQRYKGVPILGVTATLHLAADGSLQSISDNLVRDIDLDVGPHISDGDALAAVEAALHPTAYGVAPDVTLAILPVTTTTRIAPRDPSDLRDDAMQYRHEHTGYRLVYRVATAETEPHRDLVTLVDANTGEVISQRDSDRFVSNTAHTLFSGNQTIDVTVGGAGFELEDPVRDNNMVADATNDSGVPWTHAQNVWGDGSPFNPFTSRVTAGADAYFAMEVTFRMFNRVFDWQGVDDHDQRAIILVHDHRAKMNNNGRYYGLSNFSGFGNLHEIGIGDSDNHPAGEMAAIDVVGHEYTHAVDAMTAGLSGGEGDGLNEGFSDMFGVMARMYFKRGSFANSDMTIPGTSNLNFFQLGTDITAIPGPGGPLRSMTSPPIRYFVDGIASAEVHDADGPIDRMFFFLAQGASSDVTSPLWSHGVPWGMTGIGNDSAGHIVFQSLSRHIQAADGYAETRDRTIFATRDLFAQFGPEEKAVRNAFAAIDVGDPAVDAPTPPPTSAATGDLGSETNAQEVSFTAATPIAGLRKHDFTGIGRIGKDDYQITLNCGQSLGVRVEAVGTYTLAAFAAHNPSAIATATNDGHDLVLTVPSSTVCNAGTDTFFVRVLFQSAPQFVVPLYTAHFDRHTPT